MIVVVVLTINCHDESKSNMGPERHQITIPLIAAMNAMGRPERSATEEANLRNGDGGLAKISSRGSVARANAPPLIGFRHEQKAWKWRLCCPEWTDSARFKLYRRLAQRLRKFLTLRSMDGNFYPDRRLRLTSS